MSLSKTLYPLLSTGSNQEDCPDIAEKLLAGMFLFVLFLYVPSQLSMVIAGRSVHLTTLFPGQA